MLQTITQNPILSKGLILGGFNASMGAAASALQVPVVEVIGLAFMAGFVINHGVDIWLEGQKQTSNKQNNQLSI